jgi:hypothetical protein
MQNGIDISMDTSTPGTLALTLQQFSAGVATTLETTSIELPAVAPAASAYPSDAWLASFPQDDCGFTIFPTPAPTNIAYVGTLSGDFASFKPAQAFVAAAMAKSGGSDRYRRQYPAQRPIGVGAVHRRLHVRHPKPAPDPAKKFRRRRERIWKYVHAERRLVRPGFLRSAGRSFSDANDERKRV